MFSFLLLPSHSVALVCVRVLFGRSRRAWQLFCLIYLDRSRSSPWASDGLCCVCCLNLLQGWIINTAHEQISSNHYGYVCETHLLLKRWPSLFRKHTGTDRITHKSPCRKTVMPGAKPDNEPLRHNKMYLKTNPATMTAPKQKLCVLYMLQMMALLFLPKHIVSSVWCKMNISNKIKQKKMSPLALGNICHHLFNRSIRLTDNVSAGQVDSLCDSLAPQKPPSVYSPSLFLFNGDFSGPCLGL